MSKFIRISELDIEVGFDEDDIKYYYSDRPDKIFKSKLSFVNVESISEIKPITVEDCNEQYYEIYVDGRIEYINQDSFERIIAAAE